MKTAPCFMCRNLGRAPFWARLFIGDMPWCSAIRHPIANGYSAACHSEKCGRWKIKAGVMLIACSMLSGCSLYVYPLVQTTRQFNFYGPVDGATVNIEKQAKAGGIAR